MKHLVIAVLLISLFFLVLFPEWWISHLWGAGIALVLLGLSGKALSNYISWEMAKR